MESFSVFIVFSFRLYQNKKQREEEKKTVALAQLGPRKSQQKQDRISTRLRREGGGRDFFGWPEYMYTPGEIPTQICFVREIPKRF